MSLSSTALDVFAAVARTGSLSAAAHEAHLTQPALSLRVRQLEEAVGHALFVRQPRGMQLTAAGERLLAYHRAKAALEADCLHAFAEATGRGFVGVLRVAAFSTVLRSLVVPALQDFVRDNPMLELEISAAELRALPGLLASGAADIILSTSKIKRSNILNRELGEERYVMVESKKIGARSDVLLDHDRHDQTSDMFLLQTGRSQHFRRGYIDDIDTMLAGVALGFGRAVVPRHLLLSQGLRIVRGYREMRVPVFAQMLASSELSRLHQSAMNTISRFVANGLSAKTILLAESNRKR